jgi:hypothetical protein
VSEQPDPEGFRHTRATVIRCGAADADKDPLRTCLESSNDQFAETVCRCDPRVTPLRRYKHESGRTRHLNDGKTLTGHVAPCRLYGLTWQRTADRPCPFLPSKYGQQYIQQSLAAIRDRTFNNDSIRYRIPDARTDGSGHGTGVQGAFEGIGSDNDAIWPRSCYALPSCVKPGTRHWKFGSTYGSSFSCPCIRATFFFISSPRFL